MIKSTGQAQGRMVKCPICKKKAAWEGNPHRPFCSDRCRQIDLGSWADGTYQLPGEKTNIIEEQD